MTYQKKPFDQAAHMQILPQLIEHTPRIADRVVCDFCGGDDVVAIYAAKRMADGTERQCWRWCACKPCTAAVDADRWQVIEQRLTPRLKKMLARSGVPASRELLHMAIRRSIREFRDWAIREDES